MATQAPPLHPKHHDGLPHMNSTFQLNVPSHGVHDASHQRRKGAPHWPRGEMHIIVAPHWPLPGRTRSPARSWTPWPTKASSHPQRNSESLWGPGVRVSHHEGQGAGHTLHYTIQGQRSGGRVEAVMTGIAWSAVAPPSIGFGDDVAMCGPD